MTLLRTLSLVLLFSAATVSCFAEEQTIDYQQEIAPILTKYCAGCHTADDPEGKLALDSFQGLLQGGEHGPAILPGTADSSRLIRMITGKLKPIMPPEDETPLPQESIEKLIAWVNAGANGPKNGPLANRTLVVPKVTPSKKQSPVTDMAYSPDGKLIAVASYRTVELRSTIDMKTIKTLSDHPGKVNAVTFSPDGKYLLAASGITGLYGEAVCWDVQTGKVVRRFTGHSDVLYMAIASPDQSMIATASYDKQIILWDFQTGKLLRTLKGHNGAVFDIAFSPDSKILISASADATVKVWKVADGMRLDTRSEPLKEQYSVAFHPNGKFFAASGADNRIRVWRLTSTEKAKINPILVARFAHENVVHRLRYSSDGKTLVTTSADGLIKFWDTKDYTQVAALSPQSISTQALAISPSANKKTIDKIAIGRMDGSVEQVNVPEFRSAITTNVASIEEKFPSAENSHTLKEQEPNNQFQDATMVQVPANISGTIQDPNSTSDVDLYRFTAKQGEKWILEINAARKKSMLDSKIDVLDAEGNPIPSVLLRAVRDSYFTFRGKDSNQTGDFRLHNWEEMRLNQLLYCNGEVVKLFHYPRGPDSGFNVYPNFGNRHGFFDTTPLSHALGEPCYVVEAFPPTAKLPPNGLPQVMLYYENDDESQRRFGKDSYLTFVAPKDGEYIARVRDVRGFQGEKYHYELQIRPPKPDFKVKLVTTPKGEIPVETGKLFVVEVERIDGFDGPVMIGHSSLPEGFTSSAPLVIQAGQYRADGTIFLSKFVKPENDASLAFNILATATVHGKQIAKTVGTINELKPTENAKMVVSLGPSEQSRTPENDPQVIQLVAGTTMTALVKVKRNNHKGLVSFGKEDALQNAPHGVYVDNIGLNGVLIPATVSERTVFFTAEPWVTPSDYPVFMEAKEAGKPTTSPVILRILPAEKN